MRILLIVIAALALAACAAAGPAPETSAADVVQGSAPTVGEAPLDGGGDAATAALAPAQESPDDIICRNQRVTGSLRMRRVCHPRWEWAQMEVSATETMRDINSIPVPIQP